jgi:methyl-accepting chemotaxis protein
MKMEGKDGFMRNITSFLKGNSEKKKAKLPNFTKRNEEDKNQIQLGKKEKAKMKFSAKKEKVKTETEKVKEEIKERRNFFHAFRGIRVKILISIFIPIVLMALFGVVCYIRTSNAITSNYEKSTIETLNAVSNYLNLGLDTIKNKSVELVFDSNLTDYYNRFNDKESFEDMQNFNDLKQKIVVVQSTSPFIGALHIMSANGRAMSTFNSSSTVEKDLYNTFIESEDGKKVESIKSKDIWIGEHTSLDKPMSIKLDDYALSYVRPLTYGKGYVIIDISKKKIVDTLSDIDYGKGCILGFITGDGRETLSNNDKKPVFADLDYYKDSIKSEKKNGYSYQSYKGGEYLYTYSKVGETGAMVCALIPKSTILKQADSIRQLILVFVLLASILAVIVGTIIAGGIGTAISHLMKSISLAAKGDLTVKFDTKRKDEFLILSKGLNTMMEEMRNLIGEVAAVSTKVSLSASELSVTSENILGATKDISLTIDEIEKGVVQQATDTEQCSSQMANLSDKINQVYGSTYEIEQIANDTKNIVVNGIKIIDD